MPIYTDKILMDVHRMIRKGAVQFEPEDRIPLTFSNKAKDRKMTLYIGSVYYDNNLGKICYELYNHKESILPVGGLNPREIEKLSSGDLVAVADKLEDYEKMSILRHENYYEIENAIDSSRGKRVVFEVTRPRVLVPTDQRFSDQIDKFVECRVHAVFRDKITNYSYAAVKDIHGTDFNVKLPMLNDRSIMNISTCLKNIRKHTQGVIQRNPKGVTF